MRRGRKGAACRPASVCGDRPRHLGIARRTDADGSKARFIGRKFVSGRRIERHLGAGMSETLFVGHHLIARHAGSALWLARYMERIENLARLIDVTKTFARDAEGGRNWLSLLRINGDTATFFEKHAVPEAISVADFYLLDSENSTSVQWAIRCAKDNARTLRALISTEMWLQINVFHGRISALSAIDIAPEALSGLRHAEGRGSGPHRANRRHILSRPVLALLYDRAASGARRPDHAADRHQVRCTDADGGGGRGDRCRRME